MVINKVVLCFSNVVGSDNPYLKFFQRRPDRAAVWRELPPLSLDEMNLTQKAEAITEMVTKIIEIHENIMFRCLLLDRQKLRRMVIKY